MTKPLTNRDYAGNAQRLLCKGASKSANTSAKAPGQQGSSAEGRGRAVLHGRDDEPSQRSHRREAISTGGGAADASTGYDQHVEAVTQCVGGCAAEGPEDGGLLLPDLPRVRERGFRSEEGLPGRSIRQRDAARTRSGQVEPDSGFVAVPIDRSDYPKFPTDFSALPEKWQAVARQRIGEERERLGSFDPFSRYKDVEIERALMLAEARPLKPFVPFYPAKEWDAEAIEADIAQRELDDRMKRARRKAGL